MKNILFVAIVLSIAFISCNQVKLDNNEAEELIKKTLELPQKISVKVSFVEYDEDIANILQNNGFLTWEWEWVNESDKYYGVAWHSSTYNINLTTKGQQYYNGINNKKYSFITNEVDINKITGISINKEEQTATIRFSLMATNITPVGEALKYSEYLPCPLNTEIPGELLFKKFDSGWQLQSGQNKSSSEMVNQFLNVGE